MSTGAVLAIFLLKLLQNHFFKSGGKKEIFPKTKRVNMKTKKDNQFNIIIRDLSYELAYKH
jgi:hypothetical protein